MRSIRTAFLAGVALAALGAGAAQAAPSYSFQVITGLTGGNGFDTLNTPPAFIGPTASATFTYTGALNFNNTASQNGPSNPPGDLNRDFGLRAATISNYSGSGTVTYNGVQVADFAGEGRFIQSSGSVSGYGYGSWYNITLGSLVAGTNLVINHDDGISLYRNGVRVGPSVSGPTSIVTDTFTNLAAGNYSLYYSRQNGTPSILQVSVPEPASLALLGVGLAALGFARRRRGTSAA